MYTLIAHLPIHTSSPSQMPFVDGHRIDAPRWRGQGALLLDIQCLFCLFYDITVKDANRCIYNSNEEVAAILGILLYSSLYNIAAFYLYWLPTERSQKPKVYFKMLYKVSIPLNFQCRRGSIFELSTHLCYCWLYFKEIPSIYIPIQLRCVACPACTDLYFYY